MDSNRFKSEVLPLKHKLYRFASRLLEDQEQARDAVQEVFLKLWKKRESLHTLNSIEAFAMKVIKNHCLDLLKARRTISLEQSKAVFYTQNEENVVDRQVEMQDSVNYILKLMDRLPDQQKMILQLRDVEGYEFDEIEKVMEINTNTIRVNLSRARKKIRELYLNSVNNGNQKSQSFTG